MTRRIALIEPFLGGNEAAYLQECVDTNFVSSVGPFVTRFEEEFAKTVGRVHAVACGSGTAALHVAMQVAGVGPGDEVPVPTLTFIASANAVTYTGASVLLVDSEPLTWNMASECLHELIVKRAARGHKLPSAIEVVHILGHPAGIEPLLDIRERFEIPLIEDAAESLGAYYVDGNGKRVAVGAVGDLGCFSLNGNKMITAGSGGVIVTDDDAMAHRARHLTTQARLPGVAYIHDAVGFNYRMSNLHAALALAQLEQLDTFLGRKREIAGRYDAELRSCGSIVLPPRVPGMVASDWLYTVLCASEGARDAAVAAAAAAGVEVRPLWVPIHEQQPYRDAATLGGGCASDLSCRGLSLPSSVGLSSDDQERVVECLLSALEG